MTKKLNNIFKIINLPFHFLDPYYSNSQGGGHVGGLDTNLLNNMMSISLAASEVCTNQRNNFFKQSYNKSSIHNTSAILHPRSPASHFKPSSQTPTVAANKMYHQGNNNYDLYDPKNFLITNELEGARTSRFFVIKSYSKDDIIKSIKYNIWCSTEEGNRKLDKAFSESQNDKTCSVYLFFSVNGSGQLCGIAQMLSRVDYDSKSKIWSQDKWNGTFDINWIYVKDVPNIKLRYILLANNENKPVTNSRDTQEVEFNEAYEVLSIIRQHVRKSSILDEFDNNEIERVS